MKRPD